MHSQIGPHNRYLIKRHKIDTLAFAQWSALRDAVRATQKPDMSGQYAALKNYWLSRVKLLAADGFVFNNKYRMFCCGPSLYIDKKDRCHNPRICPWCWAHDVVGRLYLDLFALLTNELDAAKYLIAEVHRAVTVRIPPGPATDDRGILSDSLNVFRDLFMRSRGEVRTGMIGQTVRGGKNPDTMLLHQRALIVLEDETPELPVGQKYNPLTWAGDLVTFYDRMTSANAIRKVAAHAAGSTFAYPVEYLFCPTGDLDILNPELYGPEDRRPFFRRYGGLRLAACKSRVEQLPAERL